MKYQHLLLQRYSTGLTYIPICKNVANLFMFLILLFYLPVYELVRLRECIRHALSSSQYKQQEIDF